MEKAFKPIEQYFSGTPEELREYIVSYVSHHEVSLDIIPTYNEPNIMLVERASYKPVKDKDGIKLKFERTVQEGTIRINPTAIRISQTFLDPNCSKFRFFPHTEACNHLALAISGDIKRKGYDLPGAHTPPSSSSKVISKMGRPHKVDDVWAWNQVNIYGQPKGKVYKQWFARIEDDPKRRRMKEPRKHFYRIIKPDWG